MKAEHGWMAGAGYTISHVYYITIMKENVRVGQQTPGHKQIAVRPEDSVPDNTMSIPSDRLRLQMLGDPPLRKPSSEHIPEHIPGSEHIHGSEHIPCSENIPGSS